MQKIKILLIGYSNIAKKRYINVFHKNKIQFSIASKSYKKKIKNAHKQYSNYDDAITESNANLVFISLPNSFHFYWAKKALLNGYHVVIDKPLCTNFFEAKELISIAKKKNKLLSEAIFYNYHRQIEMIKDILKNNDKLNLIKTKFVIPLPHKESILMSNNFKGGTIMDMGPYAASIHRIFFNKKILSTNVKIRRNSKKLPISFEINVKYKCQNYHGLFKFGGKYENKANFFTKKKIFSIDRVFSPPENLDLYINLIQNNKIKTIKVLKDNCFENYFLNLLKKIKKKKYNFYYDQIIKDHLFREKIETKFS